MRGGAIDGVLVSRCGCVQYAGDVVMRRYGAYPMRTTPGYWTVSLVPDNPRMLDFFGLTQAAEAGVVAVIDDFGTLVPVGVQA